MNTANIESIVLFLLFLLPMFLLVVFYVAMVVVVATAMVYVKAGRPAWLSLIPLYSFVELLDIAGLSVWWALVVSVLTAASAAGLFICTCTDIGFWVSLALNAVVCLGTLGFMGYVYYYLARAFGENGWYALGYLFVPFIFFPMLGFGKSKFKGSKKKSDDKQKNKLIVTGILAATMLATFVVSAAFIFATVVSDSTTHEESSYSYQPQSCYKIVDGRVQHISSGAFLVASADTFEELTNYTTSDYCYGKDTKAAFFESSSIAGVDAATFHVLGADGFYAADAKRVYAGDVVVKDADPKNFTDLGYGYAKGKKTVFYLSTGDGRDWDLTILAGADVESFQTVDEWNNQYDAFDKNRTYYWGVVVATTTRQ